MNGLVVNLLCGLVIIVSVILIIKLIFEYIENKKITYVLNRIEDMSKSKDSETEKLKDCMNVVADIKMKN